MDALEKRLEKVLRRWQEVEMKISHPEALRPGDDYTGLLKEYSALQPFAESRQQAEQARKELEELALMMEENADDPAAKEILLQEECEVRRKLAAAEENIRSFLTDSAQDDRNIILEIRGGAGGEEAAIFAGDLYRMYSMYCQHKGWKQTLLSINDTELGGIKEVIFSVSGPGAWQHLQYESGVHRVQRVPETENQGRIHTSTATVAAMPEAQEVELEIDPKDLRIDTFRSSGAGGQHINKTSSAIRITHLPTGTVVECQNERSQFQNKEMAMQVLRSRLLAAKQQEQQDALNAERHGQVGSGDRSEKIRTYNFPQDRITDHRIGLTVHNIGKVLDGNLDEIEQALIQHAAAEALAKDDR